MILLVCTAFHLPDALWKSRIIRYSLIPLLFSQHTYGTGSDPDTPESLQCSLRIRRIMPSVCGVCRSDVRLASALPDCRQDAEAPWNGSAAVHTVHGGFHSVRFPFSCCRSISQVTVCRAACFCFLLSLCLRRFIRRRPYFSAFSFEIVS